MKCSRKPSVFFFGKVGFFFRRRFYDTVLRLLAFLMVYPSIIIKSVHCCAKEQVRLHSIAVHAAVGPEGGRVGMSQFNSFVALLALVAAIVWYYDYSVVAAATVSFLTEDVCQKEAASPHTPTSRKKYHG
jgi:hypothetical protein